MGDTEQQETLPFKERRLRSPKLRRGIFLLPSMFTVANLLCGYYAVVASYVGGAEQFDHAAKAIGFAILFDSLDGRVARMTGTTSEFGVQFDSMADVVSLRAHGLRLGRAQPPQPGHSWGPADLAIRLDLLPRLPHLLCMATSPLQRARHGARRLQVLRRHAHSRRRRRNRCLRARLQNAPPQRGLGHGLAPAYRRARRADDQHHSLLQLQRCSLDAPPAFSSNRVVVPASRRNLEIF